MERAVLPTEYTPGLVSVIVPAYNQAEVILETLDCVAHQTYQPMELILVDDGSTDGTRERIEAWTRAAAFPSTLTVRCVHTENRGSTAARNAGLALARGEFIQYLDADDLLHPEKIASQVEFSRSCGRTVYGDCRRFARRSGRILVYPALPVNRPETALDDWFRGHFVIPHAFLWKRADVAANGPWNEQLRVNNDGEYSLRFLIRGGRWEYCPGTWVYYRTYCDMRPRVSATKDREALGTLASVLHEMERTLAQDGRLEALRDSFAYQYWDLAKRAALVPEIRDPALAEYKRLRPHGPLPEPWMERILYGVLGVGVRKRLVTFLRRHFDIQPFRVVATVDSLADLYAFDSIVKRR